MVAGIIAITLMATVALLVIRLFSATLKFAFGFGALLFTLYWLDELYHRIAVDLAHARHVAATHVTQTAIIGVVAVLLVVAIIGAVIAIVWLRPRLAAASFDRRARRAIAQLQTAGAPVFPSTIAAVAKLEAGKVLTWMSQRPDFLPSLDGWTVPR